MSWFSDAMKWIFKYDSAGDAAQAFWMPQAYASEQNAKVTMATNIQNRANVERQNQLNLEQWNRQNAFDSPSNQMQRMRSAGLNPGLMYGGSGSIATSAPSPTMQGAHDEAPQLAGYDSPIDRILSLRMANAQVENVEADTQQKKEETKGKEIQNEVDSMNKNAFLSAYEEGLMHSAYKAGLQKEIDSARISRYSLFESAWQFAVMVGCSMSDSLVSSDFTRVGTYDGDTGDYVPDFNFSDKVLQRAKEIFNSSEEAQIEANRAAKMIAKLQQQQKKKDVDIWKWLNEKANSDNPLESIPATIALVGLWIAEQHFSAPSFNFNIGKGERKNVSSSNE